jgi:bifunctional N-acetylglucosamine-1-phosphate-uridyltransferase/glucosamine-1-phosphate-acetyltransferase GlmU-like protein
MTNNKQQTAVEWFIEELQKTRDYQRVINEANQSTSAVRDVVEQAKEMEKEQKANTWNNAINAVEKDKWESFEQYYNETYGGCEQ